MSVSDLLNLDDVKENVPRLSKLEYIQRPPDKSIAGAAFEDSDITFQFTVSGNSWWIPSKTFFATRLKVGKDATATQPEEKDYVAPAPLFMSGLFQAVDFRIANRSIGRVGSYVPQVEAVRKRLTKTKAWRESAGRTNFFEGDFKKRQLDIAVSDALDDDRVALGFDAGTNTIAVASNGVITFAQNSGAGLPTLGNIFQNGDVLVLTVAPGDVREYVINAVASGTTLQAAGTGYAAVTAAALNFSRKRAATGGDRRNDIETMWQPPHAIFDVDTPQPPGTYSFVLSPNIGNKGQASIQTAAGVRFSAADVVVERMLLYVAVVAGDTPPSDFTHYLDLTHVNCQPQTLRPNTGEQVFDYVVSPSTYALTLCAQESSAGKNTQYPPQVMKMQSDEHNTINRYRIQYAGQTQNSPDSDPSLTVDKNWMMKEWTDTMVNSNLYFSGGGCETFDSWLNEFGAIYHKTWIKPAGDTSTQANVAVTYGTAPTNGNLLLFDWSRLVSKIEYRDNRIFNIQTESA